MKRRDFLKGGAALAAYAALPAYTPGILHAAESPWAGLDTGMGQYKILQIMCYGGLSMWETFWASNAGQWHGLGNQMEDLKWNHDLCNNLPPDGNVGWNFGDTFDGTIDSTQVNFGPATYPISPDRRPDIFNRTRVCVTYPDLAVHRLAIFESLTGLRVGNPRAAGLGAAIQRYHWSRQPRVAPYSIVFAPRSAGFSDIESANPAILRGVHPGYSQPLFVKIGSDDQAFIDQLSRANIAPNADALSDLYRRQVEDSLKFKGNLLQSDAYAGYQAALSSVQSAPDLLPWFDNGKMSLEPGRVCGKINNGKVVPGLDWDVTRTSLRLAAHLLASDQLEHACVFDRGVREANAGSPYDTHHSSTVNRHVEVTCSNLFNLLDALSEVIQNPNTEQDEGGKTSSLQKISLDNTLIVIQTEFTRTANPMNGMKVGRNHNGEAGCAVLIGGPIMTRGIHGVIDEIAGVKASAPKPTGSLDPEECPLKPTDLHCGLLHAAGVDCLAQGNLSITDIGPAITNSGDTYEGLRQRVFGIGNS